MLLWLVLFFCCARFYLLCWGCGEAHGLWNCVWRLCCIPFDLMLLFYIFSVFAWIFSVFLVVLQQPQLVFTCLFCWFLIILVAVVGWCCWCSCCCCCRLTHLIAHIRSSFTVEITICTNFVCFLFNNTPTLTPRVVAAAKCCYVARLAFKYFAFFLYLVALCFCCCCCCCWLYCCGSAFSIRLLAGGICACQHIVLMCVRLLRLLPLLLWLLLGTHRGAALSMCGMLQRHCHCRRRFVLLYLYLLLFVFFFFPTH